MVHYDLIVIGGGSGGVRAARLAGELGKRVALFEEDRVGGTCVHRGCIPKKLMVYAAGFREEFETSRSYGWDPGSPSFDWKQLRRAIAAELERLEQRYLRGLERAGVEIVRARARFLDPGTVEADGRRYRADIFLVATGSRPWLPDVPGIEHVSVSDDMFRLEALPRRVLVVGSGYIGAEFASILNALGCRTTWIFRSPAPLPGFDGEVRRHLMDAMGARGVDIRPGTRAVGFEPGRAHLEGGEVLEVDRVLAATGRVPNTEGLGLGEAEVEVTSEGAIRVDKYSRTGVPHIYAVGDCTDRLMLTPVAIAEGMAFVDTVYRGRPTAVSYHNIPTAVFSMPCVAMVGRTHEEEPEAEVFRTAFRPLKATLSGGCERMLVKILVDRSDDRVLGVHLVGPDAAEIVQAVAIAVTAGLPKARFDATMALHPTAAEELVTLY